MFRLGEGGRYTSDPSDRFRGRRSLWSIEWRRTTFGRPSWTPRGRGSSSISAVTTTWVMLRIQGGMSKMLYKVRQQLVDRVLMTLFLPLSWPWQNRFFSQLVRQASGGILTFESTEPFPRVAAAPCSGELRRRKLTLQAQAGFPHNRAIFRKLKRGGGPLDN